MAWVAIRVVISDEEQYRLTVTPGTSSRDRMEITRPMLWPCSPPGRPQPQIRSSMSECSSSGTFSRTLVTMYAPRSSGRTSTSEPLRARPMAERPAATMTASVMRLQPQTRIAVSGLRHDGVDVEPGEHRAGDRERDNGIDVHRAQRDHGQHDCGQIEHGRDPG